MKSYSITAAAAALSNIVNKRTDLPSVTTAGNAFWTGTTRFYIRGIDYQPGGSSQMADPLADKAVCSRDIAEFKKLGINTVRVYITDNSANHDDCMKMLAEAGIYAVLDANNPLYSINRNSPAESYNQAYLQSVFATIDAFAKYSNTLAFFSGNEVINDIVNSTLAAPYVKATTRDMRSYIKSRGYRSIPVGYSAADVASNRMEMAHYMNCGTDDERSDFFAYNDYSRCNTDFAVSGWDQKVKNFTGYGIPLFLSEYGCITNGRDFGEVASLMNPAQMTATHSGGMLYEYALEPNNYGIAQIDGSSVKELPDFAKFQKALAANPPPPGDGGYDPKAHSVKCPASNSNWQVHDDNLPAIPDGAKTYFTAGAGPGPGLKGDGSQNAGGTSTGTATPGSGNNVPTGTSGASTASTSTNAAAAGMGPLGPLDSSSLFISGLVAMLTLLGAIVF